MIEQNKPYTFEMRNFTRRHRRRAIGEIFVVEMEVDEETWSYLGAFPDDAEGVASVMWTERAAPPEPPAKRQAKPKAEPTPYGRFWQELDKTGFHNRPDIRQWLDYYDADESAAKDRMREQLSVTKRSLEASPEVLIMALRKCDNMHSAITAVRQAWAKVAEQPDATKLRTAGGGV